MADTAKSTGAGSGFWSSLVSGASAGVHKIGTDVLPVWAANRLHAQSTNQLNQDTNNPALAPQTLNSTQTGGVLSRSKMPVMLLVAGVVGVVIIVLIKRRT